MGHFPYYHMSCFIAWYGSVYIEVSSEWWRKNSLILCHNMTFSCSLSVQHYNLTSHLTGIILATCVRLSKMYGAVVFRVFVPSPLSHRELLEVATNSCQRISNERWLRKNASQSGIKAIYWNVARNGPCIISRKITWN